IPSTPQDAYGLLNAAIAEPDPVIFLEPKKLYRSQKEAPPEADLQIEIGKAKILQPGTDLTLIGYGAMVPLCLEAAQAFQDRYAIEVIDLRTLSPLDRPALVQSVKKTGRAIVVHEAPRTLGMGAEISSCLMEEAFLYLKAPVLRITGYDTQMPYFQMENFYIPDFPRLSQGIVDTMTY
ncbi:MAG: transketolase C-terminal domain-containing protein, partial [bacterium]|nr:transketolase C-terminal domain-containing protein [bacterium]